MTAADPATEYRMPSLGADMKDGRVVEWYVEPGKAVHRGDVVGVVDTDKGAIEIEIWEDAVVDEIVVPPGEKVPVGEVLLRLRPPETGEEAPRRVTEPEPAGEERRKREPSPSEAASPRRSPSAPAAAEAPAPPRRSDVRASPAARREAEERGVDLSEIAGSGPGGAVVLEDVQGYSAGRTRAGAAKGEPEAGPPGPHATPVARRAAEVLGVDLSTIPGSGAGGLITREDVEGAAQGRSPGPEGAPGAATADRREAMRGAIAAAMTRSKREIPHYYLGTTASAGPAVDWLAMENRDRPPAKRLLAVSLFLKAVALALREFPELNGHWVDDAFRGGEAVHPGLAIALRGGGLVAPAIHDAGHKTLEELSVAVTDVVTRARSGRLRGSEMTDATITVSSLGDRGVETLFGVIYPPQVALVGVGRIVERPWAESGMIGVRPVVNLTLSGDHRASDGHRGALFLEAVADLIQHPEDL